MNLSVTWALVDVVAVDEGVSGVAVRADAGEAAGGVAADGVGAALGGRMNELMNELKNWWICKQIDEFIRVGTILKFS